MTTVLLTVYVLMWPVIVAFVLFFIARGFFRDVSESKKAGRPII
ncbi:putative transporter small subunit [Citricoccus sp. NPDC079358]|uniref:Transporter small subunit n=2 Tax=Citricoccus parietis TaxID=592307 RepID=A0ABV6F8M8_9MICC